MPIPMTPQLQDYLSSRDRAFAEFFEFHTLEGVKRCWNQYVETDFEGQDWTPMGDRIGYEGRVESQLGLVPSRITVKIDASRLGDESDFVHQLLTSQWHQRRIVIRKVAFQDAAFTQPLEVVQIIRAYMDQAPVSYAPGLPTMARMACETGSFRYRAVDRHKRTDENQRYFYLDDRGLEHSATAGKHARPWWKTLGEIPGY